MGAIAFYTAAPSKAVASMAAACAAATKSLWFGMVRAHQQRRSEAELKHLNDAVLKDIGMHRSEITSVVYHGAKDITRRAR